MSEISVLLVEDDARLARFTSDFLRKNGVAVTHAADGIAATREAATNQHDAVVLDLMLPGKGGLSVCRDIRATSDVPILMVTARDTEVDRILGLELGADDYMTKPFSVRELHARIRAAVRRARGQAGPPSLPLRVGPLTLHVASMRATMGSRVLDLTSHEFSVLRALVERRGRVLSREQLLEIVNGSADDAFDRSIDVCVSRLRHKLGENTRRPSILRTVRRVGYVVSWDGEP